MASKSKQQEAKQDKRDLILSTALKAFASAGYGSARLDDIAKEAGLSYGLVYYYYNSKETLFHAVMQNVMLKAPRLLPPEQANGMNAYDRLLSYTENYFNWLKTPEGRCGTILMDQTLTLEVVPELTKLVVLEHDSIITKSLNEVFTELEEQGCTDGKDLDHLIRFYRAMFSGVSFSYIASKNPAVLDPEFILSALNLTRPA